MKKEVGQLIAQRDNYLNLASQEVDQTVKDRYLKAARQLEEAIDGSSGEDAVFTPTPETIVENTPYQPKEYEKTVIHGRPGRDGKDAVVDYDKIISTVTKKIKERPEKVVKIEKSLSEEEIEEIKESIKKDISYDDLKDIPLYRPAARDYDFLELKDVPKSYTGKAGKVLKVKTDERGIEFADDASGTGDVVGPSSSVDNAIARFDGLTGKVIQNNSGATLEDNGDISVNGVFIDSDSENNSSQFSYGYGFDPLLSEYFNKKFRIDSFLETPFFSTGVARNYLLQTEVFGTTWVNTGGTLTSNDVLNPGGSLTADSITAGPDADSNILQTITNNATGYWSAGLWLRSPAGAGTVGLQINSGGTGGGETGTVKTVNIDAQWRFFAVTQELTAAHTTKTFKIIYGTTPISLWGARMNPGQTCNAYNVRTTSALTTATPGIFFNNTPVYATTFTGALAGNATSATSASYSNYGSYFGNTLSNTTDNTDKWEYFGAVTITYQATYSYGSAYNVELLLREMSKDGSKTAAQLETARVVLKGSLASYAGSTATFNSNIPSMAIELSGENLVLTKNDIACMVYSTSTTTKVIRVYVKLKDDNTHYNITVLNSKGASYASTGTISTSYCNFTAVASQAVITDLPAAAQGDIVYATDTTTTFNSALVTTGNITAPTIKLTTGAGAGKVLTSDADGDATWETLPSGGDMLLGTVQSVTAEKIFDKDKLSMKGTSTGKTVVSTANTSATDYTITMPAKTGTLATTDDISAKQNQIVSATSNTAAATAAKTATISGYTLTTGDLFAITFTNGNTAASMTLNINGGGALAIKSAGLAPTALTGTVTAGGTIFLYYNGTNFQMTGATQNTNTTYSEISEAEILAGTATGARTITGRRIGYLKGLLLPYVAPGTSGNVLTSNGTDWTSSAPVASGGTVYKTIKLGTEADGDDNKTFSLTTGTWSDSKYLMVFLNGVLQEEGATADYTIIDTNTIKFVNVVADADKITLRVQQ